MKRLLVMVATLIVTAHAPAFAVPVGGTFQVGPNSAGLFITVSGHLIGEGVDVNFGGDTNLIRQPIQPGQMVLAGGYTPADSASGGATIYGTTFNLCGTFPTQMCGTFSGNYAPPGGGVIAPAIGSQTTIGIPVPFSLTTLVSSPIPPVGSATTTNLVGDGSAIVTLRHVSCGPAGGTCWELRDIQATFVATPEPATLALITAGAGVLLLRTRRTGRST